MRACDVFADKKGTAVNRQSRIVFVAGHCYNPHCRAPVVACAQCVVTVSIDPVTRLPVDVVLTATGDAVPRSVDPAAAARAVRVPVCDTCVGKVNAQRSPRVRTAAERHGDHLRRLNAHLS